MKIDIEGNDIICLRSLLNIMERPVYISVELSDIELIYKLAELGYTGFKIIEQTSLLPLQIPPSNEHKAFTRHRVFKHSMKIYIRVVRKLFGRYINKALEGQYSNIFKYKHPFGSSGPFGNELAGNWLALNEVIEVYLYYKKLYESDKANIDYGYWIDIHATILESKPSEEI